jgi:hypothetical protein
MPKINNDHALRDALNGLDRRAATHSRLPLRPERHPPEQGRAGQPRHRNRAARPGRPGELEDAFKAAKAYATKTYTDCGKDTDWLAQADHFVAASAAAALTPDALLTEKQNRAWKAAMQARMAVNCTLIEEDDAPETSEAEHQYALAEAFLG